MNIYIDFIYELYYYIIKSLTLIIAINNQLLFSIKRYRCSLLNLRDRVSTNLKKYLISSRFIVIFILVFCSSNLLIRLA